MLFDVESGRVGRVSARAGLSGVAVVSYEPKEGSGWEEGTSEFPDVRRWQAPIEPGVWLRVTVTSENAVFVMARTRGNEQQPPRFEDVGRVERDFGVRAWRILGVVPALAPSVGLALMAKAVEQ